MYGLKIIKYYQLDYGEKKFHIFFILKKKLMQTLIEYMNMIFVGLTYFNHINILHTFYHTEVHF